MNREIKSLPMVALRGMTIMPEMVVHFDVSREKSIAAIQEAMAGDQKIFLVAQRSIETDDPTQEDVYEVGTVGTIKQIMKLPKHIVRVLVSGETRGILKQLQQDTPYLQAEVEVIDESDLVIQDDLNGEAMARSLKDTFLDYAARNGKMSKEAVAEILEIKSLKKLVDEIAANTPFYYVDQQEILGKVDFWERYETLAFKLVNEVQIMDIKDELQQKVKERVDKHQKEYILREQLKLIREELGDDSTLSDAEEFEKAAKNLKAPKEVKEKLKKEISRFKSSLNSPAESGVIRTYIETLLEMPWDKAGEGQSGYQICRGSAGSRSLWSGTGQRTNSGISGSTFSDEKRGEPDPVSGGTAGNRKNIDRQISCKGTEEAVCKDFTWRSAG